MRSIALLALMFSAPALAQVPDVLPHQGRVLDNGSPVDGSFAVRFAIYRSETGGSPAWSETRPIEFDGGYYSANLGEVTPIPASLLNGDSELWLGIRVGTLNELPRVRLGAVPFAVRSSVATDVDGDISPRSVSVGNRVVIDSTGAWVGDPTGLQGPPGEDADPVDVAAVLSSDGTFIGNVATDLAANHADDLRGPQGPRGNDGSPDTGQDILAKLAQVDGADSGLDADYLDGLSSEDLVLTAQEVLDLLLTVDGPGSGLDAELVGGQSVAEITQTIEDTLSVSGIEGADQTMAILVHATASGGDRSVKVAGVEAITFANSDGLAMVVIDRDTYDVVSMVNGIPVTRNFDVNNASTGLVQWATFLDASGQLQFSDHIVVLASRGPIDRFLYTSINGGPTPADLLDAMGADVDELDLGSTDTFALVGYPDVGRGNGMAMSVDTTVGTQPTADLAAIVMDGLLAGLGSNDDVVSRVGRRTLECTPATEAVIVYDDGVFRGCDGEQWNVLGGDQSHETWTFTTCGQSGRTGPTQDQCNGAYAGTTLAGDVDVTGGIQTWTVPFTGTYEIHAWGAEGAEGTYNSGQHPVARGGRGAWMSGRFELTAGEALKILVGQMGSKPGVGAYGHQPGGGGGGTFVTQQDNTPLLIAGGGGGGGDPAYGQEFGGHGRVEASGEFVVDHPSYQASGGSGGSGGSVSGNYVGAGAGYSGNGAAVGSIGSYAQSFLNGGAGGFATNHSVTSHGGFGGGGHGELCAGGGGGYSGGAAVCGWSNYGRAGGGGSYNIGTHQDNRPGDNFGHGRVKIVFLD